MPGGDGPFRSDAQVSDNARAAARTPYPSWPARAPRCFSARSLRLQDARPRPSGSTLKQSARARSLLHSSATSNATAPNHSRQPCAGSRKCSSRCNGGRDSGTRVRAAKDCLVLAAHGTRLGASYHSAGFELVGGAGGAGAAGGGVAGGGVAAGGGAVARGAAAGGGACGGGAPLHFTSSEPR